jgi:glycosyltransferase involved in cell wall biosynthesis
MSVSPLVGIVLTLNEEGHLPDCLRSLRLVTDEVIVLDSGSTDRTLDIAEAAGATIHHRRFDDYASQRNAALALVPPDRDWVLFLDADERLTDAGADEVRERLAATPDAAAFWFPRRNVFWGKELRGGGWWPDEQARLFRRGRVRYDPERTVHEVAIIDGPSGRMREPLIHLNYDSRGEFVAKQRAYTRLRARQLVASNAIPRRRAYLSAPLRELRRRLITHHGYRDGATGLFLAAVLAREEFRTVWIARRGSERRG